MYGYFLFLYTIKLINTFSKQRNKSCTKLCSPISDIVSMTNNIPTTTNETTLTIL